LENIPQPGVGVRICGYPIEIVSVKEHHIDMVRVYPRLKTRT